MDIQILVTILERHVRDGLLVLPARNDLASARLEALIEDLWQGRPLTLRLDSREVRGQSLVIAGTLPRGTSLLLPDGDLAVSGSFYLRDGQAELALSAPLADGYRLSDSFEALRPTTVQGAVFANASFRIDSAGVPGSSGPAAEDRRWLFAGGLRVAGEPLFRNLRWLLGEPQRIEMQGAVRFVATPDGRTVPLFALAGAVRQPFELGPFEAESAVEISARLIEGAGGSRRHGVAVEILNTVRAGGIALPLALRVDRGNPLLQTLRLRGDAPRISSVSQLSSVVDGPDYAGLLPPQVPLGAGLRLSRLELTVAPATRRFAGLEIGLALDAGLEVIPGVLEIEQVEVAFRFPNVSQLSQAAVRLAAVLDIAGVGLEAAITMPGPRFEARLPQGRAIPITGLLRHFFGEGSLPEGVELDVVVLGIAAEPRPQIYSLEAVLDGRIPLGFGLFDLTLDGLILNVESAPGGLSGLLSCFFTLLGTSFEASAEKPAPGEAWVFSAGLIPGSTISLSSAAETLLGLSADALPELALEGVGFRIDSGSKAYTLTARTAGFWEFQVTDDYLLRLAVDVRIERDAARKLSGELTGELFVNDFRVLTTYSFDPGVRRLQLEIQYQDLRLAASISSEQKPLGGGKRTVLRVDLGTLDLGAALRYLTDVAAPGLDITLDEPWDLLMSLQLTNTVLVIDLTDKSVGFETRVDKNFGFVSVDTVGLLYSRKAGKPAVDLRITGRFLGTSYPADKPLSWNVLDGKAPDVPGRGSGLLDIRYLGLGQRVALRSLDGIETVTQAIDRLREAVGPVDDSKPPLNQLELVHFDRDSHWLIGMEIVALSTVQLSIVFNDPYLYGLLLRLQGERAKALSGFSFEILYKKVTDDIGVFKTEVQVPDAFRRIEVGAATIVLPVIALEIYTNGNFKVDLGFPRNRDFSRSFSLQMGPFMGFGGLYFASLTGATSRRVPQIVNGEFHPVLEFGLGLAVGLGKEIRKGPLKAGLSITVEAMLEGALAWFHPYDAAVKSDQYHWIQGTLALVGRLYGEVDFVLISVSVEVIAYASATFTIESYEPIRIELSVGVSVRASIKILFVRIRFSFSIRLSESFTIGSKGTPPWIVGTRPRTLAARSVSRKLVAEALEVVEVLADAPPVFDWSPAALFAAQRTVDLTALPAFTVAPGADGSPALQGVLLLTVESGDAAAGSAEKPFDTFVLLLLSWAIRARLGTLDGEVTRAQLDEIHDALQTPGGAAAGFQYENLSELLRRNVRIRLRGNDDAPDQPGSAAVFPMIPELSYQIGDGAPLSFRDHNPVDDDYSRRVTEYFKQLSVAFGEEPAAAQKRAALGSAQRSVATVIFCDALLMLARSAAQAAQDHLAATGADRLGITRLLADLIETGRSANLGGMLSRFLLHGLQIPSPDDAAFRASSPAEIRAAGRTEAALTPLYILTGQQFAAPAGALKITVDKSADADWIELVVPAPAPAADGEEAPPAPAGLVIALSAAEVAAESPATRISVPFHGPEPLPLSQAVPVRSTLTRYLRWQDAERPGQNPTVWLFPQDLLARIETGAAAGQPYELQAGSNAGGPAPQTSPVASFAWATALEVHIRRTTTASGSALPDTYQVLGANQIGRELLRGLWTYLKQTPGSESGTRLRFLYSAAAVDGDTTPGRLVSAELDEGGTFLLQTNLSTLTTSGVEFAFAARKLARAAAAPRSGTYWASPAAPEKFIELLWEGSITGTGGYSLRYRTAAGEALPDTVFSDRGEAVLWLVVLLGNQGGAAPDRRLLPFHNAAVVGDDLDPAAINLFAQGAGGIGGIGETTRIAAVAPGNVGFRLTRPAAEPGETPSPAERAESLFSLLGFSLREAGPFLGSNEGLPAGPKPPDGTPDDELSPDWVYERVVPVARFARVHALPDCPFLPSRGGDPYAGIGADAAATLRFAFRDVFGNPADLETDLPDLPLRVGYTDDVIGLSGWPGVSGSYELEPGAPSLVLDLDFETAGYLPTAGADAATVLATAAAHAGRYRQIYYQVMQEDLGFQLRTSLAPEAAVPVAKADLAGMVQAALVFLSGAALLRPVSHAAAGGATLGGVAADFSVGVGPLGRAQAGTRAADLFADSLRVPAYHVVAYGDTLAAVAEDAGLTLDELAAQNPGAVEPLTPGASLLLRESFVFPGPADTLGGIAESAGITVEQLAAFNAGTALRDGALLAIPGLVELEDGGSALAAPSRVRPGESLGAVTARLGLDPLEFARLHADLDLLAGGVEVQVDGLRGTTRAGDSLNAVAGRLGVTVAALAQAVSPTAGLLRSGAFVAGPAPAVDDQESLEALAARAGVTPGALARANAAVAGFLRPGASLALNGKTLTAGAHETWASLAERFRLEGIEASIEDLATAGKADRALLAAGARVLVPPAPVRLAVDLGASRNPAPIFEVAVELETARDAARVHPEMAGVEKVARQSTPLAPRSAPGANGAFALQEFARRFEAALPDLKVAAGGRRTAGEDPRAARPVWAVRFGASGADGFAGFSLDGARPAFYALRPLANRPVSQSGVPVRPYASGTGLGDPVPVNLQGVDLEVWARSFLNAVDLFLSPESAVAAFLSEAEHAAFEAVAGAKKTLADAIRLGVEPILEGDGDAAGLEAAREAVRQRLLIGLAPAYATDTLVQYRTTVASPFADPATAPRLSGRPVSRVYRTGDAEGLPSVAAAFGVSRSHLARTLGSVGKILRPGLTVTLPGHGDQTVAGTDSLATLAGRFGVAAGDLAGLSGETAGRLFAPGAVLPLTGLRRAAKPSDTFETLADFFGLSIATVAEAAQDTAGIFRAGAVLRVDGHEPVTVAAGATLRQLAAIVGLSPADLAEELRSEPGLFGPAFEARAVTVIPDHTLSTAKTPLADGGSAVTFLLDVKAEAERRKVFLDLDYAVNELEHDIENVEGVEGYQASSWLSFLRPVAGGTAGPFSTALGLAEIPLPLRSYPEPAALTGQSGEATFDAPADLREARQWTYGFRFQHQDAAQDTTFLRLVLDEDGTGPAEGPAEGAAGGSLFAALAEFAAAWPTLERDLAGLRKPGGEGSETARIAVQTFADLARTVAAGWSEHWSPSLKRALRAARSVRQVFEYRMTRTVRPGSDPAELETLVLTSLSGRPGPLGRFPEMSWIDAQGQAHRLVKESEEPEECIYRYAEAVPAFARVEHLCELPGLDVVPLQNGVGGLQITRNAGLVSAGPTREVFVYRTPVAAFPSPIVPLLVRDAVMPLRQGDEGLEASLRRLFGELAAAADGTLPLVLQVTARYGYELVPGLAADPIVSLLPILYRPRFLYQDTFPAELAVAIETWAGNRNPNRQGGFYLFDVGVFSSLDESLPWPILDLRGLVYRLDTVGAEVRPLAAAGRG